MSVDVEDLDVFLREQLHETRHELEILTLHYDLGVLFPHGKPLRPHVSDVDRVRVNADWTGVATKPLERNYHRRYLALLIRDWFPVAQLRVVVRRNVVVVAKGKIDTYTTLRSRRSVVDA